MPFDTAGFKFDVGDALTDLQDLNDLRIMRAALEKISNEQNWCKDWSKRDAHCVVGWMNVCAGDRPAGKTGRAIAARRLFREMPTTDKILQLWKGDGADSSKNRTSAVLWFNDHKGWRAARELLVKAITRLERGDPQR